MITEDETRPSDTRNLEPVDIKIFNQDYNSGGQEPEVTIHADSF